MAFMIIRFLTTGGMLPKFGRENPFIIAKCYVGEPSMVNSYLQPLFQLVEGLIFCQIYYNLAEWVMVAPFGKVKQS